MIETRIFMKNDAIISGLAQLGTFLKEFISNDIEHFNEEQNQLFSLMKRAEIENPWFTPESFRFCFQNWADNLTEERIKAWVSPYPTASQPKRIGLILAGNIPLVGFHDVICVLLSGHIPLIKLSSKDQIVLPFLLKKWNDFSEQNLEFHLVEKLENHDAVIATGSNNTAQYLEYYFRDVPNIIRKNRTSIGILSGNETDEELKNLAQDIFQYFGLGCRNVTRLFIPENMILDRLFENFIDYKEIINHHKYANNYDYNRAIYLLNQDKFWDNNFVMLKEDEKLFSPLSVINFTRYQDINKVKNFISENENEIQCVVANPQLGIKDSLNFGEAQCPVLDTYADNVDTMEFLSKL